MPVQQNFNPSFGQSPAPSWWPAGVPVEPEKDDVEEWYSEHIESGAKRYGAKSVSRKDNLSKILNPKGRSGGGGISLTNAPKTDMETAGLVVPELMRGYGDETNIDDVLAMGGFNISTVEDRVNAYRMVGFLLEDLATSHGLEVHAVCYGDGIYHLLNISKLPIDTPLESGVKEVNPLQCLGVFKERYFELCGLRDNMHPVGSLGIEYGENGTEVYFAISEKHRGELKYNRGERVKLHLRLTSSSVNDTVRQ